MTDMIGAPPHYTSNNGSGIECIDITEHLSFNAGNAVKYLWRHESKGDPVADLRKAQWYVQREAQRIDRQVAENGKFPVTAREAHSLWRIHEPVSRRRDAISFIFTSAGTRSWWRTPLLRQAHAVIDEMLKSLGTS